MVFSTIAAKHDDECIDDAYIDDANEQAVGLHKASGLDLSQPHGVWVEDPHGVGRCVQEKNGPRRGPPACLFGNYLVSLPQNQSTHECSKSHLSHCHQHEGP